MTTSTTYATVVVPGTPAHDVGAPAHVVTALTGMPHHAFVIDPAAADTTEFLERYQWPAQSAANTLVVVGKGNGATVYAVCVILASTRLDVNKSVKSALGLRKVSFAPMDYAVAETGMEYGAITPFGTPREWPILIDSRVIDAGIIVLGGGQRLVKIATDGRLLADLPAAEVVHGLANPR
ncbi:MAG: hypothetical protein CME34_18055 [Gordonia sp.]|uniref:YbaK/EbsC family protein n=1 Tax=Gordonia sp. (in: high G+C Gram-positive bacteria) TaxID=84139 RepID=UPI000C421CED|nr:YbaK/EbsC family protein [Gordonia sp. (in: high G+C Gram-positive bacteria)]MAU83733.1 hypothetical protein [Gordonia sp. (in: high G+C Gram-positive bacteria)]